MIDKKYIDVCSRIEEIGIMPVINIPRPELAEALAGALIEGGIPAIEITFRCESALESLQIIKNAYPKMLVGAGTILTISQAEAALKAGADFIVSPGYDQKLVDYCIGQDEAVFPGCSGASEIQAAYNSGLRVVKFFPAEISGGLDAIKILGGPFSGIRFMPTGGIKFDNLEKYLGCDKVVACGGSFMAPAEMLEAGDFTGITLNCRKAVQSAVSFELAHIGINNEDAKKTAGVIANLFGMSVIEKSKSVFAGTIVECMKIPFYGEKGHIGIRTSNMVRAMAWMGSKGIEMLEESKQYDDKGNLTCIYLKDEIAGFAIHIVK